MTKFTQSPFSLADLEKRIDERSRANAEQSYTRALLDRGPAQCAKKMSEEAIETVIAAVQDDKAHFVAESADLIYHLMVLMKSRGVSLAEVEAELNKRTSRSGHAEKASRPKVGT